MLSAEAGTTFPYNGDRYGKVRSSRQVAAIEDYPEETVAAMEAEADILDGCDFSTLDDQTIAALYEDIAQEDPLYPYEEDFPHGQ